MKYKNKKIVVDGIVYDSRAEYEYGVILEEMQTKGLITDLQRQKEYVIIPKNKKFRETKYRCDYVYTDQEGKEHVIDIKSPSTAKDDVFLLKKKLMYEKHQILIEVVLCKYEKKLKKYVFF